MAHEHDSGSTPVEGAQYDFAAIQSKWLPIWDELKPFATADPDDKRPRKYVLDTVSYTHLRAHETQWKSRMPSYA